jgi:hypothetical protein
MISKNWSHRLFWSLMDMAATNSYIIYRHFHPQTTHSEFFQQLAEEMLNFGRSGGGLTRRSLRSFLSGTDTSECSTPVPSLRSPSQLLQPVCLENLLGTIVELVMYASEKADSPWAPKDQMVPTGRISTSPTLDAKPVELLCAPLGLAGWSSTMNSWGTLIPIAITTFFEICVTICMK